MRADASGVSMSAAWRMAGVWGAVWLCCALSVSQARAQDVGGASGGSDTTDEVGEGGAAEEAQREPVAPVLSGPATGLIDALIEPEAGEGEEGGYDLGSGEVVGRRVQGATPGARFEIELGQLKDLPFKNAADMMMLAPGVLVTTHGGEGHAHETFMRGFFAAEGQDIEYMVEGVPLNEIGNAHGHGYADMLFIPTMFVEGVTITAGPFDPEQGDFAFAGSANYKLGMRERGVFVEGGYGSWDTQRLRLAYGPEGMSSGTFGGVEIHQSQGFGENRASQRASAVARYEEDAGGAGLRWSATLFGYLARYDQAGVLREDDVESGAVDLFDTYSPNQGGESARTLAVVSLGAGPSSAEVEQQMWLGLRGMRLRQNFTGALNPYSAPGDPRVTYPGDTQEGRYEALQMGGRGAYHLRRVWRGDLAQELSMGYHARYDRGRTEFVYLTDRLLVPYEQLFDRELSVLGVAGWMRLDSALTQRVRVRGGLRMDAFSFAVRDLTESEQGAQEGVEQVSDQTIAATGLAPNPRVSVEIKLLREAQEAAQAQGDGAAVSETVRHRLDAVVSAGRGTRSTDAAALSNNENAPFATSRQVEVGLLGGRRDVEGPWSHQAQVSYLYARVDRDQLFNPGAGRNILIGPSERHAGLLNARSTYRDRLDLLWNVGVTRATTIEEERTSPEFGEEVLLPYIPRVIGRFDAAYRGERAGVLPGGETLGWRVATGLTYTPGRPLPFGEFGDPFYLVGGSAGLSAWGVSLGVEVRNALDQRYRQSEFNYPSRWDRSVPLPSAGAPPNARHVVAGEPRFVMLTLEVELGRWFSHDRSGLDTPPAAGGHTHD